MPLEEQAKERLLGGVGRGLSAAAEHEELAVAGGGVGDDLGGEHFLFAPDHDVLERVLELMLGQQSLMHVFDIVEQRDKQVGRERFSI